MQVVIKQNQQAKGQHHHRAKARLGLITGCIVMKSYLAAV